MRLIEKVWFYNHRAKYMLVPLLLPLMALFFLLSHTRRLAYKVGLLKTGQLACPVIVVGNIGIGGNGKTPLVVHLVELCHAFGLQPGVISRGYGANAPHYPYQVTQDSTAVEAGDEPLLIFQRSKAPVVIGADRIAGATRLIELGCNIIIADDGLQHYKLPRATEFIVVDGKRLFGNGLLLPAGPLREGVWRLKSASRVIFNGEVSSHCPVDKTHALAMQLTATKVCHINTGKALALEDFISQHPQVSALAGIGDPQRFFSTLAGYQFDLIHQQGFVDHHQFSAQDLAAFHVDFPLLMTEKDAVKCQAFARDNCWYLPVSAEFSAQDNQALIHEIKQALLKA